MNELSVIVPCYNGEGYICSSLKAIEDEVKNLAGSYEIILVDDGSTDRTFREAQKVRSDNIKIFRYEKNSGKGHAVKYGFKFAAGKLVSFIDADLDLHPRQISRFLGEMKKTGADIVIGSKRHPESMVNYPLKRKILSRIYQALVWALFGLNVRDTQVGLKLFKFKCLKDIMPKILVKKYAFDLEILANAHRLGYKIVEAPIELDFKNSSSINTYAIWKMFLDTLAVFYRMRILRYYDKK